MIACSLGVSQDEDAEAEEVQSVEDEVSAAHSDSDEEDREEKKEDKGDNKEMETGLLAALLCHPISK